MFTRSHELPTLTLMKYTIETQVKGKRTVHTCKDENGTVIATRTSENKVYGFATVCHNNATRSATGSRQMAEHARKEAADYRSTATGAGADFDKSCRTYGRAHVMENIQNGNYTKWAESREAAAIRYDGEATAWENGTHENKPHVIGWSSKLTNAPEPRSGSWLDILAIATLA